MIAIRHDEKNRVGYRPTNKLVKPEFPFIKDVINKENVLEILEASGLGIPDYYSWRSRSGCTFCFFQRQIEWVNLREKHPDAWEFAKAQEKLAKDHKSPFTWVKGKSLEDLEKPENIKRIKENHQKKLEKMRLKNKSKINENPFLVGENVEINDNLDESDVSSSCLICHK